MEALLIMIAGSLGALSRWGVGKLVRHHLDSISFLRLAGPLATLFVNVLGCFLLGLAMQLLLATDAIPRSCKAAITTGFLGAFTTFSTFGYETFDYLKDGQWSIAAINVAANLTFGLLAVWAGIVLGKALIS